MISPDRTPPGIEDDLRGALARTDQHIVPSAVPLPAIVYSGRRRRARQRAALAATGFVLVVATALPVVSLATRTGTQAPASSPPAPAPTIAATPSSLILGTGKVDGKPWSAALEYYAKLPKDFKLPAKSGTPAPGASLLCTRVTIGGVRVDAQGGRWADCALANGPGSLPVGTGLHSLTGKGLTGTRILVGVARHNVARVVVALTNGEQIRAAAKPFSDAPYRGYAVAVASDRTIAAVDEYDAAGHRLSHETQWR